MAEIQQHQTTNRRGRRAAHKPVRIDMTPLVDLAFLLLTFFVLTSELSKQHAITTVYPNQKGDMPVNNGLTVLLGKNSENIFWYRGEFDPSMHLNVSKGNSEMLNVLKNANEVVFDQMEVINRQHDLGLLNDANWKKQSAQFLSDKSVPFVIVKWDDEANYQSVVTLIDDLNRTHNNKYAVVSVSDEEKLLMKQATK